MDLRKLNIGHNTCQVNFGEEKKSRKTSFKRILKMELENRIEFQVISGLGSSPDKEKSHKVRH